MADTTPHWPSYDREPVGVGAGLTDFEAYAASDPTFAAAWGEVNSQLNVEGAVASDIDLAKTAFVNSYEQMAQSLGVTGEDAINAAKQFTTIGHTVMGAIDTVNGLQQATAGGAPPAVVQAFTGTLIALAVSTGAISAGLGACITLGVGAILQGMQALGLWGPSGVAIPGCPSTQCNPASDLIAGCLCLWTKYPRVAPGAINWRPFPQPSVGEDARWFVQGGALGAADLETAQPWHDVSFFVPPHVRAIDAAFPHYNEVMTLVGTSAFANAFVAAWQANAAYPLNGLQAQPDEAVLLHALRLWNRAHQGPATLLSEGSASYLEKLVNPALNYVQPTDASLVSGRSLLINTGPTKAPARVVSLSLKGSAAAAMAPKTSTATKVVAGSAIAVGAGIAGAAIYSYVKGEAIGAVLKHLWKKVF